MGVALHDWSLAIKNLFLPVFCKQCDARILTEENVFFCAACWMASPRITRPFCTICGRPHRGAVGFGTQSNFLCADCRGSSFPFRRIYGAAIYGGAAGTAIRLLKFYDRQSLARPLARMMAKFAANEVDCGQYDYLVPVPLHKVRQRERGYNQSKLIAEHLLPAFPNAQLDESLRRIRPTRVQSLSLTTAERRANVRGAFAVSGDVLKGKTVLLVDDVVTTGGTTAECARALKRAGVTVVDVMAAALAARAGGH